MALKRSNLIKSALCAASMVSLAPLAGHAAPAIGSIFSPIDGVIDVSGPGFGGLSDTFNQAGLSAGFTSGVTSFAAYDPAAVTHTLVFSGNEWFSEENTTSATVTYDLGSSIGIDKLALWNDEFSGIGSLDLFVSNDGMNFSSLALDLTPTNNPMNADYVADVFSFGAVSARYIRFAMSGCPQADPGNFPSCAIGEVAFSAADVGMVPEPGTYALMLAGLLAVGVACRRRQR